MKTTLRKIQGALEKKKKKKKKAAIWHTTPELTAPSSTKFSLPSS
jgi:hypothetical protein